MLKSMGLASRPFEFYVAFLVFIMGLYGIVDPNWPPLDAEPWEAVILIFEDIYLMIAGVVIMASFAFRKSNPIPSIVAEMFGWLFVGCAAAMIVLTAPWIPVSIFVDTDVANGVDFFTHAIWMVLWAGLCASSLTRYFGMRHWHKGGAK